MTDMPEIKPCPFCGGEADLMYPEFEATNEGTVMCMDCFAVSPDCDEWRDAITKWNNGEVERGLSET